MTHQDASSKDAVDTSRPKDAEGTHVRCFFPNLLFLLESQKHLFLFTDFFLVRFLHFEGRGCPEEISQPFAASTPHTHLMTTTPGVFGVPLSQATPPGCAVPPIITDCLDFLADNAGSSPQSPLSKAHIFLSSQSHPNSTSTRGPLCQQQCQCSSSTETGTAV